MPMTDPMDGLRSFQQAYRRGLIQVHRTATDKVVYHEDQPEGEPRLTFARIEGDLVVGIAQIVLAEPYEGDRCFGLGYAVRPSHRGRGIATALAQVAIAEFARALVRGGARAFHVEAIVGAENVASQRVAEKVLGPAAKETTDEVSGEPAIQYIRRVEV